MFWLCVTDVSSHATRERQQEVKFTRAGSVVPTLQCPELLLFFSSVRPVILVYCGKKLCVVISRYTVFVFGHRAERVMHHKCFAQRSNCRCCDALHASFLPILMSNLTVFNFLSRLLCRITYAHNSCLKGVLGAWLRAATSYVRCHTMTVWRHSFLSWAAAIFLHCFHSINITPTPVW